MKRLKQLIPYRPLLLQIGILLLILSIVLFFMNQKKKFVSVDFSKQYEKNKTIELSGFEEGDRWNGNYSYDTERVFEGKTSITLSSWYGKENSIVNANAITIPPGYINGYMSIFITDKQNISSLKMLSLELIGEKDEKKLFDFTPLVRVGWNRIPVLIPHWKKITKQTLFITSKNDTIAEVNIDRFWIENTSQYNADILTTKSKSLSLRTIGERVYLYSSSPSYEKYIVTDSPYIQKGTAAISLIPEHGKEMLFSLNNTFMKVMGKNMNECLLTDVNGKSVTKTLKKKSAKNDVYVFLKAEVADKKIVYSLSNNGLDFETCGSTAFAQKGPIFFSLQGSYLIDSLSLEY